MFRRSALALALTLSAAALAPLSVSAQAPAKPKLVIGATAGSNYDQLKAGIIPLLEKKGYQVKLVEFNDYVQPNFALAQGSLDANFFQHRAYLNKFVADQKLDIVELVQGPVAPMGVYAKSRKSLEEAKLGDRVTLPNDPANLARALGLLQQNGLITIKAGVDALRVSEKDLAENPRKLKLIPLEAAQLPRSVGDTEYAMVPGNFAISSGMKLTDAVVLEKTPDHYLNVVAVRRADKDSAWAKDIAEAYRSKAFNDVVDTQFKGYAKPAFLN